MTEQPDPNLPPDEPSYDARAAGARRPAGARDRPAAYGAAPQYAPHPGGQPPMRPDEERMWAAAAHFGPFLVGFIAPLVVYLVFKDRSPWLKASSGSALNFNLSWMIWIVVSILTLVGWIVVLPAYIVLLIIGGVKSLNGEVYKYPLTINFVK